MFVCNKPCGTPILKLFSFLYKNNIQQAFQKLHTLLKEEFSSEDLQIIACPSMEQVRIETPYFVVYFFMQLPLSCLIVQHYLNG